MHVVEWSENDDPSGVETERSGGSTFGREDQESTDTAVGNDSRGTANSRLCDLSQGKPENLQQVQSEKVRCGEIGLWTH